MCLIILVLCFYLLYKHLVVVLHMRRRLTMSWHLQYVDDVMAHFESWWGPSTGHFVRKRDHGAVAPCTAKAHDIRRWPRATKRSKNQRNLTNLNVAGDTTAGKSFKKIAFGMLIETSKPTFL